MDDALDLDRRDVVGERWRTGGLQRRRHRVDGMIGGDGDREDARLGNDGGVTGDAGLQPAGEHIACVQRKNGYRFDMGARALCDTSAAVSSAVMSVSWR